MSSKSKRATVREIKREHRPPPNVVTDRKPNPDVTPIPTSIRALNGPNVRRTNGRGV